MFGFYPSPYIVIVMLAAAGVSLPLLFWFTTRLLNLTPGKRVLVVATSATALLLLLSSSGPLLKVFSQDPEPPVVGEWTFETVIDPNPLETGSVGGSTVTFRAIFTVDQDNGETATALSASITSGGSGIGINADLGTDLDGGNVGIGVGIDETLSASAGANFTDSSCSTDLIAGVITCVVDVLDGKRLYAKSAATPSTYDAAFNFPFSLSFTATASTADQADFTAGTADKASGVDSSLAQQFQVIFGPPANLTPTLANGEVSLAWDDPSNSYIVGYEYRQSIDGGTIWDPDWTAIDTSDHTTTSHTVSGLSNGTEYTFEVRAYDAYHKGTAARVTATPKTAPDNPENLRATVSDAEILLTWDAPVSDGGSDVTNYEYRQRADSGSSWSPDWDDIANSDASTSSFAVTGLTNNTLYTFEVRTENSVGAGAKSTLKATPPDGPVVSGPDAPLDLSATAGDGQVQLTWDTPVSDGGEAITGYQYRQSVDGGSTWNPD